MTLADWQQQYLDGWTPAYDMEGLPVEDWRVLIGRFAFVKGGGAYGKGDQEFDEAFDRLLAPEPSAKSTPLRMYFLGREVEAARRAAPPDQPQLPLGVLAPGEEAKPSVDLNVPDDVSALVAADPELSGLIDAFDEAARLPDSQRLFAYTEAALLRAIQHKAEDEPSVEDLTALAVAYYTLTSVYFGQS